MTRPNLGVIVTAQVDANELEKVNQIAELIEEAYKLLGSLKKDLQVRSKLHD